MPESTKELSGRELSAFVAGHLFGEPMPPIPKECPFDINHAEPSPEGHWQHVHTYENGDACEWEPFPYGEDIEAAMQVTMKMQEAGWESRIGTHSYGPRWTVEMFLTKDNLIRRESAESDSLPEAICKCALAAIGSKE
jgi:hypothetical protein